MKNVRVTVWNEFIHEQSDEEVKAVYPEGIHSCIKQFLEKEGMEVTTATLEMPSHGLTDEVLSQTEVLVWWGHVGHEKVEDAIVEKVHQRVLEGMGLIVLHSGHASKIFQKVCGTNTHLLRWRENNEKEILWNINPTHPITKGLPEQICLPAEETYGENFRIPTPDELIFIGWFEGGEVFRSGCTFRRGLGKIFYFQPGHESFPTYYNPQIQKVISNAVLWAQTETPPVLVQDNVPQAFKVFENLK